MTYRNIAFFSWLPLRKSQRGRYHLVLVVGLTVLLLLIGVRLALPNLVKNYLNNNMADMGEYSGHIENVDLAIWRGAYTIHEINVVKVNENVSVPFFESSAINLSLSWPALLQGMIVAKVELIKPELHFVDANDETEQTGAGTDWRDALQQLIPIRIDRLVIQQGELHFHNFQSDPPVHLVLTELNGQFSDLSNKDRSSPASFALRGLVLGNAGAFMEGHLNPLSDFRNFDIKLRIEDIDLVKINDLAEAYGHFNMESGQGKFVMALEANEGMLKGYARPLFDNVAILDLSKDSEQGVLGVVWESIVAGLGQLFRNQPEDRIAAEIEISGSLDQENISPWQAFLSILRNAFIKAYDAQFREE